MIIEVASDLPALVLKYGKKNMENLPDQFLEHRSQGFLHAKGRLDCVLTIQNATNEPMTNLVLKRSLKPSNAEGSEIPLRDISIDPLEPKKKFSAKYVVEYQKLEKPMDLTVQVVDPKKGPIATKKIEFQAQRDPFNQYLTVTARRENWKFKDSDVYEDCLIVRVARAETEPVTEPIRYDDILFSFNNEAPVCTLDRGESLGRGKTVYTAYRIRSSDVEIPYKVIVEGSEVEGKIKVK